MITSKLLRYEKTGKNGRSGLVGISNDSPPGTRVFEAMGIPTRYNQTEAWTWIQSQYTDQYMWDNGRILIPGEVNTWQLLWDAAALIIEINDDIVACQIDYANCPLAGTAEIRVLLQSIITRQQTVLGHEARIFSVVERIIRLMPPSGDEASGGNSI